MIGVSVETRVTYQRKLEAHQSNLQITIQQRTAQLEETVSKLQSVLRKVATEEYRTRLVMNTVPDALVLVNGTHYNV